MPRRNKKAAIISGGVEFNEGPDGTARAAPSTVDAAHAAPYSILDIKSHSLILPQILKIGLSQLL